MPKMLVLLLVTALAAPPGALADGGPSPGVTQNGTGAGGTGIRYVALGNRVTTELAAVDRRSGKVLDWRSIPGNWGIPLATYDGTPTGLSADGSTLVLAPVNPYTCKPQGGCALSRSTFAVYSTKSLRPKETVHLRGVFSADALSPDGRTLYLIQFVPSPNFEQYRVRAYDLAQRRLLPGAIADRTQRGWLMQGQPMARVTSSGGRFVYTLYANEGGYPFVHALDTVRGVAHCIGLPWHLSDQGLIADMRLTLGNGGRMLTIADPSVRAPAVAPSFRIDTHTYVVSEPGTSHPSGFPWWTLGFLGIPALVLVLVALRRLRVPGLRAAAAHG
ncbi:MAG TPA: hypothetical protein VG265_14490 [Gaiellaceae bacterium]|jgi:hypothetical protein|nr:hypothetical protein [Gaiellaceae bacterium]